MHLHKLCHGSTPCLWETGLLFEPEKWGMVESLSRVLIVTYTALTMVLIYHPLCDRHYSWCSTKSKCSLEGLMLKLKLQYFGYLMRRADSLEKTLMLGKIEGKRRKGQHRMRWLDVITNSMDNGSGWTPWVGNGQGGLACCVSWGHKELDTTERLNWTEKNRIMEEAMNLTIDSSVTSSW